MSKFYRSKSLLLWLLAHAFVMRGVVGAGGAEFDANGVALKAAALCYVLNRDCNSGALPVAAQGTDSTNVKAYYGATIGSWRTGRVEIFDEVFKSMSVSSEERKRYFPCFGDGCTWILVISIVAIYLLTVSFVSPSRTSMRTFPGGMCPKGNLSSKCFT